MKPTPLEKLKIDRKTSIDLVTKYHHLKLYAQNVLTYYPIFDEIDNIIECNNTGNIETSARIEIIANGDINKPLIVKDLTKGTFFGLDIDAVSGDKIIIDSGEYSVTKNGVNILSSRIPGSLWIRIGESTKLLIKDKDGNIPFNDFTVNIYFRNSLL